MITEFDIVKMIFGFKVKYLRKQKGLTYQQLSKVSGMSLSYIHEVEKGKKYPKPDKIELLARSLDTDYDSLVSKKVDKKLQAVIDLLTSDFLKLFPLDEFGVSPYKLFELFSNAPDKVNAFISTLFNLTRKYQMRTESFYKSALRSYQNLHDNYFEDIETAARNFKKEYGVSLKPTYSLEELEDLLKQLDNITVDHEGIKSSSDLSKVRSYYSKQQKKLFVNPDLSDSQLKFLLVREIGFQVLGIKERPYVTRIMEVTSFEELLNNFRASYFAVSFLMDSRLIAKDITTFCKLPQWDEKTFLGYLDKYDVTPEMFLQRLTNILPAKFGVKDLFFIRMSGREGAAKFELTKELHLSQLHSPYANENQEHYCRKWLSLDLIKRQKENISKKGNVPIADIQVSKYWETTNEYLCISIAKNDDPSTQDGVSVTVGLMINERLRQLVRFLGDPEVPTKVVNTTCERCTMPDCPVREVAPVFEMKKRNTEQVYSALKLLEEKDVVLE